MRFLFDVCDASHARWLHVPTAFSTHPLNEHTSSVTEKHLREECNVTVIKDTKEMSQNAVFLLDPLATLTVKSQKFTFENEHMQLSKRHIVYR